MCICHLPSMYSLTINMYRLTGSLKNKLLNEINIFKIFLNKKNLPLSCHVSANDQQAAIILLVNPTPSSSQVRHPHVNTPTVKRKK